MKADKCSVRDGKFIDPCESLAKACEDGNPPPGKQRGIYEWRYSSLTALKPTRSFFGVKTTEHPKGLAFNVCPWCGERIDAPFTDERSAEPTRAGTERHTRNEPDPESGIRISPAKQGKENRHE